MALILPALVLTCSDAAYCGWPGVCRYAVHSAHVRRMQGMLSIGVLRQSAGLHLKTWRTPCAPYAGLASMASGGVVEHALPGPQTR